MERIDMNISRHPLAPVALGLKILLLLCVFLSVPQSAEARSLEAVKKSGKLKVGVEPGFLPFEMKLPSGKWVGFDVDMMTAFAKTIGVKVEFVDTKWDGIIPALMAGKFDCIVSGMTITPERKKAVAFSDPYYDAGLQALVTQKTFQKAKTLQDLDKKGVKVAVKLGTTGDIFASKTLKNAQLMKLESEADAANSVKLGKADAFIYDKPFLNLFTSSQKKSAPGKEQNALLLLDGLLSQEQFGVAMRPKDKDLMQAFNAFLADWKKSGGHAAALKKHFVEMPWKSELKHLW